MVAVFKIRFSLFNRAEVFVFVIFPQAVFFSFKLYSMQILFIQNFDSVLSNHHQDLFLLAILLYA